MTPKPQVVVPPDDQRYGGLEERGVAYGWIVGVGGVRRERFAQHPEAGIGLQEVLGHLRKVVDRGVGLNPGRSQAVRAPCLSPAFRSAPSPP